MKKYLYIEADTNDADYISSKNEVSDEEIELIKPVIEAIKNFKPYTVEDEDGMKWTHNHNFPNGEYCPREDLGEKSSRDLYGHLDGYDQFAELCPHGEYGIHSIESVEIIVVAEEITLL